MRFPEELTVYVKFGTPEYPAAVEPPSRPDWLRKVIESCRLDKVGTNPLSNVLFAPN